MRALRTQLAVWLHALATWIAPAPVAVFRDPIVELARRLCALQEANWPERSGESKRHQVYAQLLKDFPSASRRDISRAIEDAL